MYTENSGEMMNIELFQIIKREFSGKPKPEKKYKYSKVAVINTLQKAIDLT